jgi:hypothetical protein
MSTSGIYNYHPKVEHPKAVMTQMASDCHQPPFFFGGSQVPINLGHAHGSGFKTLYKDSRLRPNYKLQRIPSTSIEKHSKIMIPHKGSGLGVGLGTGLYE